MSTRGLASGRVVGGRAVTDPAAGERRPSSTGRVTGRGGGSTSRPAGPTGPVRLRRLPLPMLLGGMLLAGLCALLALNTASAAQELTQRALTDSNASASDVEQQLVRDLAAKQAPAALASAALAQGLVPNPNPAFLRINADGSVTVLGSPTPASIPPPPSTPTPSSTPASSPSSSAHHSAGRSTGASASGRPTPAVTVTVTRTATAPHPSASPTASGRHR